MTYTPRSEFLNVMQSRGYMADCTDLQSLDDALTSGTSGAVDGARTRDPRRDRPVL